MKVTASSRAVGRRVARVILDPVAKAHLLQHLEVVLGAHFQALRLEQFPLRLELAIRWSSSVRIEVSARFNLSAGVTNCLAGKKVISLTTRALAGHWIKTGDGIDLIAKNSIRTASSSAVAG